MEKRYGWALLALASVVAVTTTVVALRRQDDLRLQHDRELAQAAYDYGWSIGHVAGSRARGDPDGTP